MGRSTYDMIWCSIFLCAQSLVSVSSPGVTTIDLPSCHVGWFKPDISSCSLEAALEAFRWHKLLRDCCLISIDCMSMFICKWKIINICVISRWQSDDVRWLLCVSRRSRYTPTTSMTWVLLLPQDVKRGNCNSRVLTVFTSLCICLTYVSCWIFAY